VLTVRHQLDLGTVVAFLSYLSRLYMALTGLSNIQVTVMTALVSFERVFEVLDLPPMIRDAPDAVPVPTGPARIAFDHVSFHYPTPAEVSLASLESIASLDTTVEKTVLNDILLSPNRASLWLWSVLPAEGRPPSLTWWPGSTTSRTAR
jgi:ATP-binding cassette subfamily B protein